MADKKVVGGLKWVKGEIGTTLRPVRDLVATGGVSESLKDLTPAVQALEQVHGVLLALQLTTPARLVEDMTRLAERIADTDAAIPHEAIQVLGQALGQLTNHLDRLDAGFDEPPLSLWSILNEVRAACDQLPLSHSELLTFAAVTRDGDSQWMPEELDILAEVMRQVRPQFHRHLVEWYREDTQRQGLLALGGLFHQLHDYLKEGLLADVFRLAEVFVEALETGRLETGPAERTLMGHLDWVQKPLTQKPPQWPEVDAKTLIEQLLAILAEAQIESRVIGELKIRYGASRSGLSASMGQSTGMEGDEAVAELAIAALAEFAALKEQFDIITHADQADQADQSAIKAFCGTLRRLAATLDDSDVGNLPSRMRALAEKFDALDGADFGGDLSRFESYAMELLGIEAVLLAHAGHRSLQSEQIIAPDMDLTELFSATLREAGYELLRVKEAIAAWQTEQRAPDQLGSVNGYLQSVSGALRILGENPAADLAETLGSLIHKAYVRGGRTPTESQFEHLADAIAGLELYIGHLQEAMPLGDELVDRAGKSVSALYAELGDLADIPDEVAVEPVAEDEAETSVELGAAGETETEFMDIFLEEAREETASAQVEFARWESNPHDTDALKTLRRSFHTLKGSGRLVGAQQVAELAQAMELLLNRLLETETFPSESVLACVSAVVAALPELVSAESEGRLYAIESHLMRASELRGELQGAPDTQATSETVTETPTQDSAITALAGTLTDHDSLFVADEELLSIFQTETHEHLAELRAFLQRVEAGEPKVDEPVQRALHTLTGSARMSGIDSIARATKALELCVKPAIVSGERLDDALLALFRRTVDGVQARVDELPEVGAGAAVLTELLDELESRIPAPVEAPVEEPPKREAPVVEPPLSEQVPEEEPEDEDEDEDERGLQIEEELEIGDRFSEEVEEAEAEAPPVQAMAPPPTRPPEPAAAPIDVQPAPDPDLAALFLEDARDLLDNLDTQFRSWQLAPQDVALLDGINRLLHTLKGSARLTGLSAIGDLSHALETRLKALGDAQAGVTDTTLELAQRAVDTLSVQVDALEQGVPIPRMTALVDELSRTSEEAPAAAEQEAAVMRPAAPAPAVTLAGLFAKEHEAEPPGAREAASVSVAPQIRVRSDLLNRLVNHAGEISIYRGRLTQRNGQLGFGLGELDQTVIRLREQLRLLEIETQAQILHRFERSGATSDYDNEFDPLELDRFSRLQQLSGSLAETVNDLISVKEILGGYQREFTDLLNQQARLADDLQDGLLRTRLVPFVQVVPRLHRLVRQTADSLGKSARLEVIGPEVELDRTILDRLTAPLEHLLRNAVDHGLEDTKTRVAKGKPATGMVTLALRREGNDAVISLGDDGKGMDLEAIRQQAIARGLMPAEAKLPDEALLQFILEPGFTTSGKVTQISGRGVGLDVVASEIKAANGSITLESFPGKGARFTIRLPLTLAIIDAFLISAGENMYAVPHSTVEGAARINHDELVAIYADDTKTFTARGHQYKVIYFGNALEPGQEPELGERRWLPLLLARLGDQRVALQVDNLLESQRILVKPLGPQLAGVRWLSGGTILPDGRVALILDALALLRSGAVQDYKPAAAVAYEEAPIEPACVMVVDDSLTVRRVTSRLLRRQNMEVLTAKDGVEALTLLDERIPDLLLLDIEMPRMDGYELTRHIRRSERLQHLPIIMITSRTGAKHREYAMQLGVNRYLGKPYQESELLNEIGSLLEEHGKPLG
ncbi:hybrid sensor histidine kinase/response regulator [Thiocystis violacea]|uniref:hybrid sensor histidine kinase/response regulator n=1 Tax=Thiocystis violacea TaxID=13725 RepID=UPI00190315E6|nr:Hpt domain-containing protein [Thiocystis violacea]MBK1723325.1 hybrid sensor histidine kinase/response regulator [Thiocystis violacea]